MYTYDYPRPAVTADVVMFGFDGQSLKLLLIQRKLEPFQGQWALPGGFMHDDETIDVCALRELYEETHFTPEYIEQYHVYSALGRDPRGRVVTVAFFGLMPISSVTADTDAQQAQWFSLDQLPPLAFDHQQILADAQQALRERVYFKPLAFSLLGTKFTMTELQHVYEVILGCTFDRRNFHKKMLSSQIIQPCDERRIGAHSRPAQLYTFSAAQYLSMKQRSDFEF